MLAGIVSYMGGSLLSTWLHHQVLSLSDSSSGKYSIATERLPIDPGKAEKYFEVILERNIFNAQKTEIEESLEPPEDLTILAPETGEEEAVERTSLALALAGTMIYGAKSSFAFISKKDNLHNYVIFGTGECFNASTIQRDQECSPESVKILEIKDRWVLILHDGKKQALWMKSPVEAAKTAPAKAKTTKTQTGTVQGKKTGALVVSPQEKNVAEVKATPSSAAKGENTFHFQRVWVDEQLADFGQLLNDARVIPTKKDGKPYFMFQYIKKESIYEQLGLKPNDIILEINGFLVDTVDKALKLLEVLQSEREIALMVEREGNPVQFHYFID
jgi:type II secretory pathway component PulC